MGMTTIPVKDGINASQTAIVAANGSGHIAPAHVLVDSSGAEVLVARDATIAPLGVQGDTAWVSGNGTAISILKGIFGKISATVLAAGSAVIGKVTIDNTTPGTTDRVTVGGKIVDVSATFTRQANTTAYSAGQIVNDNSANPLDFVSAVRVSGGTGLLLSSRLTVQQTSLAGVQFRLYLFKSTPGTTTDAASYSTLWANRDISLGWVDFLSPVSAGSSPDATVYEGVGSAGLALPLVAAASDIFGVLVALTAYTPASAIGISCHLRIDQN